MQAHVRVLRHSGTVLLYCSAICGLRLKAMYGEWRGGGAGSLRSIGPRRRGSTGWCGSFSLTAPTPPIRTTTGAAQCASLGHAHHSVTDSDAQPTADDVNCAQHTTCKLACNEHATCNTVTAKPAPCNMIRRRLRFAHRHRCAVRPRGTMLMTRPRLMRRPRSAFVSHVV